MKKKGFIKLLINILTKPGITDLVNEEGAVGFGVYIMVVLYLAQCDDSEGAFTNGQLYALAVMSKKSRAYVKHIICDYGLFEIEGRRFHELILTQYSHARKDMYAGEDVDIDKEKENIEKVSACVCLNDTQPEEMAAPTPIGPSAYESVDRKGCRHGGHGELVPWWAPPQTDVYRVWSLLQEQWIPLSQYDKKAELMRRNNMQPDDFMMKTAWEKLDESEHNRIQDYARRK